MESPLPKLVPLLLGLAGAACDASDPGVQAAAPVPPPAGTFDPRVEPTRVLRGYSLDGAGEVPWLADSAPEALALGELGRTAATGLYCTFNGTLEREAELQPRGWALEARGAVQSPGRFGGGLRLERDGLLTATLAPEARALPAWSLEFWLFPTRLDRRDLLELPGCLRLYVDGESKLVLELPGAQPPGPKGSTTLTVRNPTVLVAGRWHHVGLVLDRTEARGVRLVVDGTPFGTKFDPALVAPMPERLLLGDVKGRTNGLECVLDELRFLHRNASTAELAERARIERGPVARLRLEYATGTEELELWSSPLTDASLDTPEEWACGEREHAYVGDRGLTWTPEHWQRLACPNRPMGRTTHPTVAIGGGRVFTFGGETRDTHWGRGPNTDDTWIFDGARADWTRVVTPEAPSPRCHMPAAYSPDHDLLLLVGGWWQGGWWEGAPPERRYADTWVFHVAEGRWEQRFPEGMDLKEVSDHGLVYLPELRRFALFVGNTVRLYDPEADRWEARVRFEAEVRDPSIPKRESLVSYMTALDPTSGNVLFFGGSYQVKGEEVFVDRTALYDPRTRRVTVLSPQKSPAPRVRSALAFDPRRERFVLFGGVRDQRSQRFDDLWTFDPRTREWSEVERGAERPMALGGFFGMAYDEGADHFVMACGRNGFESWSDDTWTLSLDERAEGHARYVFDRGALEPGLSWFAELETPDDSAVRFRFRASADGLRFGAWSESCPEGGRFLQVEVALVPGARGARPLVRAMGFRAET